MGKWIAWKDPEPKKQKPSPWANHPNAVAARKDEKRDDKGRKRTAHIYVTDHATNKVTKSKFRGTPSDVQDHIRELRAASKGNATVVIHTWSG